MQTSSKPAHTSAPWDAYEHIAGLIEGSGGRGVHLSPEDYDHAVKCVNAHDGLVEELRVALDWLTLPSGATPTADRIECARKALRRALVITK